MKLVIPIFSAGTPIREINFCQPSPGVLADVSNASEAGSHYEAVRTFIAGSMEEIEGEPTERAQAKATANLMPFQSAMQAVVEISKLIKGEDAVSGVYACPECDAKNYAQKKGDIDTRDHTDDLTRLYMETDEENFEVELGKPAIIEDSKGEVLTSVSKMTFRWPTLADCIKIASTGVKDKSRLQMGILAECIVRYNQEVPDQKWRNRYGKLLFERMALQDYRKVTAAFNKYRLDLNVTRTCRECGIAFDEDINVKSFFGSALRNEATEGAKNGPEI